MPITVEHRLAYRGPFAFDALVAFLALRAVPGLEEVTEHGYRRTLRLPHGPGVLAISGVTGRAVRAAFSLADERDLAIAVTHARHLFDLDADSATIDAALGADPRLASLVADAPGRRVPHAVDGTELAVRAVLGQQVSVKGARTLAARLVARHGTPLGEPDGGLTHVFPDAATLATADLDGLGLTGARIATIHRLAEAISGGLRVEPGVDPIELTRVLVTLPGIGPWTAGYIAMRGAGDSDAFLPTDLGVRHALERLGLASSPAAATAHAERWRPWRAYALVHLWGQDR